MDYVLNQLIHNLNTQDFAGQDKDKVMKTLLENLDSIDFSDAENRKAAEGFVSNILNVKIGRNNEQITDFQAVAMHYMIARFSIIDQGVSVDKINYSYREKDTYGGAFYREADNSINFYFDNICHKRYFIEPYAKEKEGDYGARGRLSYFLSQMMALNHELRHVEQFNGFHSVKTVDDLTPERFLMMNECLAREFARVVGSKYQKKTYGNQVHADRLYRENHEEFLFEVDANKVGYEQALKFMKKLCPKGYEVALGKNEKYMEKISDLTKKMHDYQQITWRHDTNPNEAGVRADHKAILIIDTIIPMMNAADRKYYFGKYPSLLISHYDNGKRKTLEAVENDRKRKIEDLIVNYNGKDKDARLANIGRLYETAIEGDPILSLENCLRHIAKLSYESDRYFTPSGIEVKYSAKHISQEIKMAQQKAKALISYIEEADRKAVDRLLAKYEKEAVKDFKTFAGRHLAEEKKLAFIALQHAARKNSALSEDRDNERIESFKQKQREDAAKEMLKKLFPEVPLQRYVFIAGADGQITARDNAEEKFLLLQAYSNLSSMTANASVRAGLKDAGALTLMDVRDAINTVYPFEISKQANENFCNLQEIGDITPFKSVFEAEQTKEIAEVPLTREVVKEREV